MYGLQDRHQEKHHEGLFEETYDRVTHSDITARKHGGNEASVAANDDAENVKRWHHSRIMGLIECYPHGLTSKEYVDWLNIYHARNDGEEWSLNQISGRFSELKKANLIRECRTMGRRNGCAVLVLVDSVDERSEAA